VDVFFLKHGVFRQLPLIINHCSVSNFGKLWPYTQHFRSTTNVVLLKCCV